MRIFYLINEPVEGYQVGYRGALNALVEEEIVEACSYFSFQVMEKKFGSWSKTLRYMLDAIKAFKPNVLLVAHLSKGQGISKEYIAEIRNALNGKIVFAYDERDMYGRFRKPLHGSVLEFASQCDITFLVGAGSFSERFRRAGCKNIVYLPHVADTVQFGTPWTPTQDRRYDVIMIGNRLRSRIPFLSMPGVREREQLVKGLYRIFKDRFAVFGRHWGRFAGNQGMIPFSEQEKILRTSWASIGYDHFPKTDLYFSDRLPIALLSEVAHITGQSPGLDNLFMHGKHLMFFKEVDEGIEICQQMLQWPRSRLIEMGLAGASIIREKYTENIRMKKIVNNIIKLNSIAIGKINGASL